MVRRGTIVEEGSHRELVRIPDGAYATLVRLQQQRAAAGDQDADSLVRRAMHSSSPIHACCSSTWSSHVGGPVLAQLELMRPPCQCCVTKPGMRVVRGADACVARMCSVGHDFTTIVLQAALTDAVEGEAGSRRSMESVHASRRSIGSGSATGDVDGKSAKAVAAFKDPRVSFVSCTADSVVTQLLSSLRHRQ